MFLEAQFGNDITPIETPRLDMTATTLKALPSHVKSPTVPNPAKAEDSPEPSTLKKEPSSSDNEDATSHIDAEKARAQALQAELARLHAAGLYVPGVEIRAERYVAKVWLETLEVECASAVFGQRVKAVVERAAETVAPLWSVGAGAKGRA